MAGTRSVTQVNYAAWLWDAELRFAGFGVLAMGLTAAELAGDPETAATA